MKNEEIRDWNSFFQILNPDNTMSFNRYIAHAIGITETIIYFSLISKMMNHMKNNRLDNEGFFYATVGDIQESTTIKKEKQIVAIKRLVEIGLIETKKAGIPARKYFRIVKNLELLLQLTAKGETVAQNIRDEYRNRMRTSRKSDSNQLSENPTTSERTDKADSNQLSEFTTASCGDVPTASCGDVPTAIYKTKVNKPNSDNPNFYQSSIGDFITEDRNDTIDGRTEYEELIKTNIDYDWYIETAKTDLRINSELEYVNEIVSIMLDIVCSQKPTIRVNGEEMPQEVVKAVFLKLNQSHIEYVLDSMNANTSKVNNIRSYLITTLYNAPSTINSYYSSLVNHNMNGKE